jgi:peptide/nickel transport system substrate-binding protein
MGEVTADLLKKIGMTVDFVATDWGTVGQRRASKSPPGQGGWGMFHTWHSGGRARAGGRPEKEVTAWFSAKDPARVDTTNGRDAAHAQTGLHDQSSLGLRRSSHQKDGKIVTCERW